MMNESLQGVGQRARMLKHPGQSVCCISQSVCLRSPSVQRQSDSQENEASAMAADCARMGRSSQVKESVIGGGTEYLS